jgi:hypothetical protein
VSGMSFWRSSKRQAAATTIALKQTMSTTQFSVRASDAARSMNPSEPTFAPARLHGKMVPFLGSFTAATCDHGLRPVCARCSLGRLQLYSIGCAPVWINSALNLTEGRSQALW